MTNEEIIKELEEVLKSFLAGFADIAQDEIEELIKKLQPKPLDGDFYYVKDVRTILQDLADEAKCNNNLDRLYIINEICEHFE